MNQSESHESSPPPDLTRILRRISAGEPAASDELLPVVYQHLRGIAQRRMAGERPEHTLQATELVHEAYLQLRGNQRIAWRDRGHFFGAAAEAMRRILVDHARRKKRVKRGGGRRRVPLNVVDLASHDDPERILALDRAVTALAALDPALARVVQLRFYAGLSVPETARALGISNATVKREWAVARAWLFEQVESR